MPKFNFKDADGANQEVDLPVTIYREAADAGMSVVQLVNKNFPTDAATYGTTFEQFMASAGLFLTPNNAYGIRPPSMREVFEGSTRLSAGTIIRDATPSSRLLFPTVALGVVENQLRANTSSYVSQFESLVSRTDAIAGPKFDQPILNYSRPEAARSQPIAQGAMPHVMMSVTVSEISRKIPTFSLGMEFTQESLEATSLPLVTMALTRQAEIERAAIIDSAIGVMVNGDVDAGIGALSAVKANTFDAGIAAAGSLSHLAWVKWLRKNYRTRTIDWVFCDLAGALAIENRTGKPVVTTDDPNSPRINPLAEVSNPAWQNVRIFLLEDGLLPANTIVGIDSRYAIWKVTNSQADYSAVEDFVLRKTTAMRFDFGQQYYRQFDQAFEVLSLTL